MLFNEPIYSPDRSAVWSSGSIHESYSVPALPTLDYIPLETKLAGRIGQHTASDLERAPAKAGGTLQLNLVLAGTATYRIAGQVLSVAPRSLTWIFPGQEYRREDAAPDFHAWCIEFEAPFLAQACASPGYEPLIQQSPEGTHCRRLSKAGTKRLDAHCGALSLPGLDLAQFNAGLAYLLLAAWSEFQKAADAKESAGLHPAVEKAARILRAQPETGSLNQLAKTCGASASWLSRLFRQQMSISLVEYRNHCRIERFFELYRDGQHRNIAQTASEAGFGSYAQFHRVFRKNVGYGPAELRRRLHSEPPSDARQHVPIAGSA